MEREIENMGQQQSPTLNQSPSRKQSIIQWLVVEISAAIALMFILGGIYASFSTQNVVYSVISITLAAISIVLAVLGLLFTSSGRKFLSHLKQTIKIGLLVITVSSLIISILGNVYQFIHPQLKIVERASYVPLSDFQRDLREANQKQLQLRDQGGQWQTVQTGEPSCTFESDGYHVMVTAKPASCLNQFTTLGNFALQVRVEILTGNRASLVFHWNGSNPLYTFYDFYIKTGGTCGLNDQAGRGAVHHFLIPEMPTCNLTPGQHVWNQLGVIAVGNVINLYINGQRLREYPSFIDWRSTQPEQSGQFGMNVGDDNTTKTEAVFSDLQVWTYDTPGT